MSDAMPRENPRAGREVVAVFAAVPQAVGDARNFTTRTLGRWALSHLSDTASLLVSELMTNVVRHAGGIFDATGDLVELSGRGPRVMLGLTAVDSLVIEVWDTSDALPIPRTATDDQEDGRGLLLVEALSKEWGCKPLRTGGKITWFALDLATV